MSYPNLLTATRKPLDIFLNVISGEIPTDLSGFVFINSGAGSVNSNGLPFPQNMPDGSPNQEYGAPVINGDGYMFRFDLSESGKIHLKTSIFCTPCYYADKATSPIANPKDNRFWHLGFKNYGIARISPKLGTRNQLNTAITPFRLPNDKGNLRLLATFDAGRPFEFDPKNLQLITPIGKNEFWQGGMPPFMKQPIAMVLTTAHPVFDPKTQEVFSVNFTKTTMALAEATTIFDIFSQIAPNDTNAINKLEQKLLNKVIEWEKREVGEKLYQDVTDFFHTLEDKIEASFLGDFWKWLEKIFWKFIGKKFSNENQIYVIRWQGEQNPQEWKVLDTNGEGIEIQHNMHQIGFTKDYLLLGDTNFKFSFDVMINNPFPHNYTIDNFFRKLISGIMNDYSTIYIVKRKDLLPNKKSVIAQKVTLPVETVHFSANYENPNDIITVHTAHNCCACPAEWLRPYDVLKMSGKAVDTQRLGLISVGEMDIGKIGKCVIDAKNGNVVPEKTVFLHLTGEDAQGALTQAHTWAVGLYTYCGMLSPDENTAEIKHVFWQCYGLSKDMLTNFIYDLYENPKRNRVFQAKEVLEYTQKEAPYILQCVDTDSMSVSDYFTFPKDYFMWSLQFVPRKKSENSTENSTENLANSKTPTQKDGYILCTVLTTTLNAQQQKQHNSEVWIFDANDLKKGAICKLDHPDLQFAFTIHSVWVKDAAEVSTPNYVIPMKPDYDYMIKKITDKAVQSDVQTIFDEYVYPHFK